MCINDGHVESAMNVLLISAKVENPSGGIAVWTEHYLTGCKEIENLFCDLVNVAMNGRRAACATAKRSLKDEVLRTYGIMGQLNERLKHGAYDVAHLNTNIGAFGIVRDYFIARKVAKRGIPVILHFHCDVPKWDTNFITRYFLKRILKICKMEYVLCESSRQYLRDAYGVESTKIPNFVDEDLIVQSKAIREHIRKVMFSGRVSISKGAAEIFEVAKYFPDIAFALAGEVSEEIAPLKHPDNIVLAGVQEHKTVISDLDAADLFLFPSHTEGFSLALAEAMARGLPAVATDVGANAEMLNDQGGIVVAVGDVRAMKDAVMQLDDSDIREKMSLWNLKKVKEQYETKQVMRMLIQSYENVAKKGNK